MRKYIVILVLMDMMLSCSLMEQDNYYIPNQYFVLNAQDQSQIKKDGPISIINGQAINGHVVKVENGDTISHHKYYKGKKHGLQIDRLPTKTERFYHLGKK